MPNPKLFSLYPLPENRTFTFAEYADLASLAYGKKSVLEFGPGTSTFALIEAGVARIVSLEYSDEWYDKAKETFKDYPQVTILKFANVAPMAVAEELDPGEQFDMAFVDSPKGYSPFVLKGPRFKTPPGERVRLPGQEDCSRLNTCLLALKHAPLVYLHDAYRATERATAGRLSGMGYKVGYLPHTAGRQLGFLKIKRADYKPAFADAAGKANVKWQNLGLNLSTEHSKT